MTEDALAASLERLMSSSVDLTVRAVLATPDADELTLTQWRALVVLADAATPMRVSDVGRVIGASLPSTSRLVSRLRARGVVARAASDADRRASLISLTDRGRHVVSAVRRARHRRILAAIEDLEPPVSASVAHELEVLAMALATHPHAG